MYDPPGDGNCQFSVLALALGHFGIFRSAHTLRNDVIRYLRVNDKISDGLRVKDFLLMGWEEYITLMSRDHGGHFSHQKGASKRPAGFILKYLN